MRLQPQMVDMRVNYVQFKKHIYAILIRNKLADIFIFLKSQYVYWKKS